MSFLKNLLGAPGAADGRDDPLAQRFDAEFHRAVRRFGIVTGYGDSFTLNLRNPETRETMAPHLGLTPYFEAWKQIRSPWDRIELFFRYFLESWGAEKFHVWAVANVLTAIRLPNEALEMLQRYDLPQPGSQYHTVHCGAFARALIPLDRSEEREGRGRGGVASK
jgi:hypothetical protein